MKHARILVPIAAALLMPLVGVGVANAAPHYGTPPTVAVGYTDSATPRKSYDLSEQDARLGTWRDNKGLKHTSRVYATFDFSGYAGKSVTSGLLTVQEAGATDCTKRAIQVWRTDPVAAPPTWRTAPAERTLLDEIRTPEYCPARVSFDVSAAVAGADGKVTFAIRVPAELERDLTYGRTLSRFTSVQLSVRYNTTPTIRPDYLYQGGFACGADARALGTFPGVLQALGADADDESDLDYEFAVWPQNDPSARTTLTDSAPEVNAGTVAFPAGLENGRTYSWQARVSDGVATSAWSQPCSFVADTVEPTVPSVSATPDAAFTLSGNGNTDVKAFQYSWQELGVRGCPLGEYAILRCPEPFSGTNVVFPDAPGGSVTLTLDPPSPATTS